MKLLGFQIPNYTFPGVTNDKLFEHVVMLASTAEKAGFDSVWVMDHFYQLPNIGPPTEPMLEGYATLAGLAARTKTVRLGTLVTGVTYRNPAFLAKEVTTLDVVSSGRAILGLGAAWNEAEHRGYGYPFPPVGERISRPRPERFQRGSSEWNSAIASAESSSRSMRTSSAFACVRSRPESPRLASTRSDFPRTCVCREFGRAPPAASCRICSTTGPSSRSRTRENVSARVSQ